MNQTNINFYNLWKYIELDTPPFANLIPLFCLHYMELESKRKEINENRMQLDFVVNIFACISNNIKP